MPAPYEPGPGRVSPGMLRALRGGVRRLVRLAHRATLTGRANLPDGPYLLVANHSAGVGLSEILCVASLWPGDEGPAPPLAGFAHPLGFKVWPVSVAHRHVGTVPSTYEAAYATLGAGVPLLVFPGGDHETLRPVWQAHRVDFGGRMGFAKIAIQAQVPVVPLGIRGSHFTAPMLWRARWLAWALLLPRAMGQKRWGISLLGVLGALGVAALPWAWPWQALALLVWLGTPLSFAPWIPATIHMRVGPPLPVPAPDADPAAVRDQVQAAVQAVVDRLGQKR
ncbi:MAG: hypothetical protein H6702_13135 [Myxococcales bacterium]|nr:hypothetical protein [Myxococcales bacterium]